VILRRRFLHAEEMEATRELRRKARYLIPIEADEGLIKVIQSRIGFGVTNTLREICRSTDAKNDLSILPPVGIGWYSFGDERYKYLSHAVWKAAFGDSEIQQYKVVKSVPFQSIGVIKRVVRLYYGTY
jgi:hypothetical protein